MHAPGDARQPDPANDTSRDAPTLVPTPERAKASRAEPDDAPSPAPRTAPELGRIGRYRLLRVLGDGGFGVVHLAEQSSPHRFVAVKVLRPGLARPDTLSRFSHEAQTLAMLQHPGIAQVYEAGFYDPATGGTVTDDAAAAPWERGLLPFFAMEFVEGSALNEHIRRADLPRPARLELMLQICDAVQHAHSRGVIHRDLKPSNILVDRSGRAKILDFGISRVVGDGAPQRTLQTDAGQLVGTLGYMSPEQIAADPRQIDTRTDVYALGVILYELLTGTLPHRVQGRAVHDATRSICEDPPTRLAAVDRTLRGDLDTIAAKALEKDRARRYQSASELAADLRRTLNHEPIVARPPSTWYQWRKFARRNRVLVVGVAASLLLLAGGVVGTSYWALRATAAQHQAQREVSKASASVRFLADTLAAADPDKKGRDVRLADVLDGAAAELDSTLADQPEVAGTLGRAMARAYLGLGLFDRASELADRSVARLTSALGPEYADTLDARETAAEILASRSQFAPAETELRAVHEARVRAAGGHENIASLETLRTLSSVYGESGKLPEAEATAREVLETFSTLVGPDAPETMSAMLQLANVLAAAEKTDEAERQFNTVLRVRQRTLAPDDQRTQNVREALGNLYRMQGRYAEAAAVHAAALAVFETKYGPKHPRTLSKCSDLGKSLQQADRLDEAEAYLRRAYTGLTEVLGPDHFDTMTAAGFLSDLLQSRGNLSDAEGVRRVTVEVRTRTLGPDHPQTWVARTNLGYILADERKLDEAETIFKGLLEARSRVLGPEHAEVALTNAMLGYVCLKREDWAGAERCYRACLAIREKILPEGSGIRGLGMSSLGYALFKQGRSVEAEPLITRGADWVIADPRSPTRNKIEAATRSIEVLAALARPDAAAEWKAKLDAITAPADHAVKR